jgi:hypothetical protein
MNSSDPAAPPCGVCDRAARPPFHVMRMRGNPNKGGWCDACKAAPTPATGKKRTYGKKSAFSRHARSGLNKRARTARSAGKLQQRGHFYMAKFHCELNPIELVWGRSKWYVRQHVTGSFKYLHEDLLFESLSSENLPPTLIQQYTRKCREILRAYHENDDGCAAVANARRTYKSHRAVRLDVHGNLMEHMPM